MNQRVDDNWPTDGNDPDPSKDNRSYRGYSYKTGYGYGYGGYDADPQQHRSFKDYVIIFRERIWLFIFCFAIIVTGVLLYTLNKTPLYKSVAQIRMLRVSSAPMESSLEKKEETIDNQQDFNTWTDILKSHRISQDVERLLRSDDEKYNEFLAPYKEMEKGKDGGPIVAYPFLHEYRRIIPKRLSLVIGIEFVHPDNEIAAHVVNLYAQAFEAYQNERRIGKDVDDVNKLIPEIEKQKNKVLQLEEDLLNYAETHGGPVALKSNTDIFISELSNLKSVLNKYEEVYRAAESYWKKIQEFEQNRHSILGLSFISETTQVAGLQARLSQKRETVGILYKRYRNKHPKMIEARESLEQTERELSKAVFDAREKIFNKYDLSKTHYEETNRVYQEKLTTYEQLEKHRQVYNRMEEDLDKEKKVLEHLEVTKTKKDITTGTTASSIESLDPGVTPKDPFSPNIILNMAFGTFLGTGFGLFMVYFTAFLDNRVKSPFDIEQVIGLPLIGVIPQIRKMDAFTKARIFQSGKDNHVKEAFRTIYSSLGVNENAKGAQIFLNTSTIPGEGKSFVSTNLAFSFAESGDHVLLLDCDLRLPNVAKSLKLNRGQGLLNYLKGEIELSEAIQTNVFPNLDVMSAGGRSRSPMTIFNDSNFGEMLDMLRGYYDKIIIDSPPLAAVSDALNIVSHVDGVLFVVKYDTVKRNTAALTVRKLSDAGKPILGVILNSMKSKVAANYYYSEYYTSAYKKYYGAADGPEGK